MPTHKPKHNKMEKQNKTQKSKTAKVAKTKERRISNKKVESLHKYWEAFPGLKRRLIQPVEGENYSLIKPKDIKNAVYANAGVKRATNYINDFEYRTSESLLSSLCNNSEDFNPEVIRTATKDAARKVYSTLPIINLREIQNRIDYFWPLAEEYYKACKDGGIKACRKHPLFISAMKRSVAERTLREEGKEKMPASYVFMTCGDLILEKGKYVPYSDAQRSARNQIQDLLRKIVNSWKELEENVKAEVASRINHLDETEIRYIAHAAFFEELSYIVQFQFHDSLYSLIKKLGA